MGPRLRRRRQRGRSGDGGAIREGGRGGDVGNEGRGEIGIRGGDGGNGNGRAGGRSLSGRRKEEEAEKK